MSNDKDKLRLKVQNLMISTPAVIEALRLARRCYEGARNCGDQRNLLIIGESGTGKTKVLKQFAGQYHQTRTKHGLNIPVVMASVPSKPTVKGLATELLYKMNDPMVGKRRTEQVLTKCLRELILNTGTRVILLDEFQHFVDQGSRKVQHHVADWLKILVEETGVSLIVAGLPHCTEVIEGNSQLNRRFQAPLLMPKYDWKYASHVKEFKYILYAIQQELAPFEFMDLSSDEMAFRVYCATDGTFGRLANLLVEATLNAIEKDEMVIALDDLDVASRNATYDMPGNFGSPFGRDFSLLGRM